MTKKAILKALSIKGLCADVDYVRAEPTPSGYASGWDIFLTEESEDKLFAALQGEDGADAPECRTAKDVLEWIETLPNCST